MDTPAHNHKCGTYAHYAPLRRIGMALCAIPWCCVSVIAVSLCAAGGITFGIVFDKWFHWIVPILAIVHGYNVMSYIRHPHKTRGQTIAVALMTALLLGSIFFHFTDFHDALFAHHTH